MIIYIVNNYIKNSGYTKIVEDYLYIYNCFFFLIYLSCGFNFN